jgi:hypothetical protein
VPGCSEAFRKATVTWHIIPGAEKVVLPEYGHLQCALGLVRVSILGKPGRTPKIFLLDGKKFAVVNVWCYRGQAIVDGTLAAGPKTAAIVETEAPNLPRGHTNGPTQAGAGSRGMSNGTSTRLPLPEELKALTLDELTKTGPTALICQLVSNG